MKNIINFAFLISLAALFLSSCKKDKEMPVITISSPVEHSEHLWGSEVHIMALFTDDRGLKSYTVQLGDEEGSHDHLFDFEVSGDLSGVSHDFHGHFVVPDNAAMMRWVHFTVTDKEDKVTTKKWMLHFAQ